MVAHTPALEESRIKHRLIAEQGGGTEHFGPREFFPVFPIPRNLQKGVAGRSKCSVAVPKPKLPGGPTQHNYGIYPMNYPTDVSNQVVSRSSGEAAAILALSGGGGRDKNVSVGVVAAVLGVSLAGALAFAYTRPADNKW